MTYRNCLKLIEIAEKKGTDTPEWIEDMKQKLDVFFLANRLSEPEYNTLIKKLEKDKEKGAVL